MFVLGLIFLSFLQSATFGIRAVPSAEGLSKPVYVTSLPDNPFYIYIVEQSGLVKVSFKGEVSSQPFLDITDRVHNPFFPGDERGLLGFAVSPTYKEDAKVYVNYIEKGSNNTIVSSFC